MRENGNESAPHGPGALAWDFGGRNGPANGLGASGALAPGQFAISARMRWATASLS
jgi:hypothetical protein